MKLKFIALNALLLIGILAIVWQARLRWQEAQARRAANLNTQIKPVAAPRLTPAPKPDAAPAAKYADVANKDLFVKDRNPVVIVDPPKVEKPKEMPKLPIVYGVLGLPSGTKAIMAERKDTASATVRQGDTVGEFTILTLDPQNVTFGWNGQEISRKIDDLIDRAGPGDVAGGGRANNLPVPPEVAAANQLQQDLRTQQNKAVQASNVPAGPASIGVEIGTPGQSERACAPGDTSPAGTVVSGYKKTNAPPSPFGVVCRWVPAQ